MSVAFGAKVVGLDHYGWVDHGYFDILIGSVVFVYSFLQGIIPENFGFQKCLNVNRISRDLFLEWLDHWDSVDIWLYNERICWPDHNIRFWVNSVELCDIWRNMKLSDWVDILGNPNEGRFESGLIWCRWCYSYFLEGSRDNSKSRLFLFEPCNLNVRLRRLIWLWGLFLKIEEWLGLLGLWFFRRLYPKNLINRVDQVIMSTGLQPRIGKNVFGGLLFILFENFLSFSFSLLLYSRHEFGLLFLHNRRLKVYDF